jgi:hypothetical protein
MRAVTADLTTRLGSADGPLSLSLLPVVEQYPVYGSLIVDDLGYIWVGNVVRADAQPHYEIFHPDGRWLGSLSLAARLRATAHRYRSVPGVRRDRERGDRIERLALERTAAGQSRGH